MQKILSSKKISEETDFYDDQQQYFLSVRNLFRKFCYGLTVVNGTSEFVKHISFDIMLQFHVHSIPTAPKKC